MRNNLLKRRTIATAAVACGLGVVVAGLSLARAEERPVVNKEGNNMVTVRVMKSDGTLAAAQPVPKFTLTDAEWKQRLTPEQYRVTRNSGTEPAFCGGLLKNKEAGLYVCVDCGLPLFESKTKFESGTGWPSFYQPAVKENVAEHVDRSFGMERTEINCARCDGHLGHVFDDGPKPTGLRYCLNSEALRFVKDADLGTLAGKDGNAVASTTQPVVDAR